MHRNDGRGSARDEFFRHVEEYGVPAQDIVDGASWYVRNGGNGEYKLHAQTWINRRQYEDGCVSEREFLARHAERASNVVQINAPKSKWLSEYEAKRGEA